MTILLFILIGLIAIAAAGFVAWPLLRNGVAGPRRMAAFGFGAVVVLLGVGAYLALGRPDIALDGLRRPDDNNLSGLVVELIKHVRAYPNDAEGWTLLGRSYWTLGNASEASKALKEAVRLAKKKGPADSILLVSYAATSIEASGTLDKDVKAALDDVLARDPKNADARYYLGLGLAGEGQTQEAITVWQQLLSDAPANASYRKTVTDQLAALTAQTIAAGQGATPDIAAMVSSLAARLKDNPKDLDGWKRLLRAYAVLGDTAKANEALKSACTAFANDPSALKALDESARDNGIAASSEGATGSPSGTANPQKQNGG
jgi:cytochrome c-type biogenesis protein CcmH